MARITVEDCTEVVSSPFELVVLASRRAKDISSGAPLTVERDNDKDAVVALREIALQTIDESVLRETIIQDTQRQLITDHMDAAGNLGTVAATEEIEAEMQHATNTPEDAALEESGYSFNEDNLQVDD